MQGADLMALEPEPAPLARRPAKPKVMTKRQNKKHNAEIHGCRSFEHEGGKKMDRETSSGTLMGVALDWDTSTVSVTRRILDSRTGLITAMSRILDWNTDVTLTTSTLTTAATNTSDSTHIDTEYPDDDYDYDSYDHTPFERQPSPTTTTHSAGDHRDKESTRNILSDLLERSIAVQHKVNGSTLFTILSSVPCPAKRVWYAAEINLKASLRAFAYALARPEARFGIGQVIKDLYSEL
ncbi:hypothetical protein TI39_contig4306g00001 [Zymoseptoria brevis]|uniref:Uncharacterized protein n=1 Tax=Zymoseptoria brevis TaxID=1047168 RepID=A0A0F4G810_9PEZI|nr:hypothetical protein TI39_contig4306g00001 [Zymoseptoria brevis]